MFKLVLRKLLQIDQPIPSRSDAEIAAEVERNYRWNFAVNLLDGVTFWFGGSFISPSTIAPLFISKLTTSQWPLGLLAVMAQGGWSLPQLFTANAVEQLARKKPVVVNLGFFLGRLPLWMLIIAALVAGRAPALALTLFFVSIAWHTLGAGIVAIAWQDLLARCFPVERRGRFLGTTWFVGASMGMVSAALSVWLLRTFPFPTNFVYTFTIAAAVITLSWVFLALVREPVQGTTASRQSNREFWVKLPGILRNDHNFRHFLMARALLAMGSMGTGFITVAAIRRWQVPDSTVGIYTATLLLGQMAGNLVFGFLADRFGHKLCLELGALFATSSFALAWLAPSVELYYAVFTLAGLAAGATFISGTLVVMEFCEPQRRPTYIGLANTTIGVVSVGAPLLGTGVANVSYSWLFALSAAVNLIALVVMRWGVQEPRWNEKAGFFPET